MELVECGDCHHQISDEAYSCPNCGKPMRRSRVAKPLLGIGLFLLCVLLPLFGLAFFYVFRTVVRNLRTSVKGVGEDILRRF